MKELLINFSQILSTFLFSLGMWGPVFSSILIIVESMVPILPLSLFVTLNFYVLGHLKGFVISYLFTIVGCNIAFLMCKKLFAQKLKESLEKRDKHKLKKALKVFSKLSLSQLAILMAFPFTPAFLVNILSGISNMNSKKFFVSSLIGKPFMVYFWGYIGTSLIDSINHPMNLVKIFILLILSYVISKIVNKKLELE